MSPVSRWQQNLFWRSSRILPHDCPPPRNTTTSLCSRFLADRSALAWLRPRCLDGSTLHDATIWPLFSIFGKNQTDRNREEFRLPSGARKSPKNEPREPRDGGYGFFPIWPVWGPSKWCDRAAAPGLDRSMLRPLSWSPPRQIGPSERVMTIHVWRGARSLAGCDGVIAV